MSFLSDAFEGNWSHLGTDISHAGSSLASHPDQMWETIGGAAALATGGLALGAGAGLFGAGAGAGEGILAGGAALPGIAPEAAAASGGFEAAAGGGFDAATAGYGTAGLTNAAGESLGAIDPLAQGSADAGGSIGAEGASVGKAGVGATSSAGNFMDTLASPSQWTLPGVAKGAGVLAAGAGLGMNLLRGNQVDPYQQKLQDSANQLGAQGQVLESYLRTGKLPPALQAQLDQWETSKRAQIIAGAAARGQPTDPLMNSALAQDLSNLKLQGLAQMAETQVNLLNAGLKETGMSMDAYKTIALMDQKQQEDLMKSIQNMAMALAGGFGGSGGGMTLKLA
mgnify:CR=1 FL=1